jgi:hypothetical protein
MNRLHKTFDIPVLIERGCDRICRRQTGHGLSSELMPPSGPDSLPQPVRSPALELAADAARLCGDNIVSEVVE